MEIKKLRKKTDKELIEWYKDWQMQRLLHWGKLKGNGHQKIETNIYQRDKLTAARVLTILNERLSVDELKKLKLWQR